MMAFLALAMAALYGLGRRLADAETGVWAAFLFATAPFVVFSLTNFQLDLPLAAMVAFAVYALVRSESFGNARWSLALGAVFGFGMLTKPPFAIYAAPPVLWGLWCALRSPDRRRRLGWAAAALAIGALLALPWYGPRLFGLPMQILNRSFKQAAEQQNPEPLTSAALPLLSADPPHPARAPRGRAAPVGTVGAQEASRRARRCSGSPPSRPSSSSP